MCEKIECPECGCPKAIVAIWGTADYDGDELTIRNVEMDHKDYFECPHCFHKGYYSDFRKEDDN